MNPGNQTCNSRWGALAHGMSIGLGLLLLVLSLQSGNCQTNESPAAAGANRYLLVVETSRAMQRGMSTVDAVIEDLFGPSNRLSVHQGDTVGVWTFSEEVSTGRLPLQTWAPASAEAVSGRIRKFVEAESLARTATLNQLCSMLPKLIKNSEFITVVLIHSGEGSLSGTGHDEEINKIYEAWQSKQQKSGMPFVLVLRAKHGAVTDFTVTPAPWPIEVPPLPSELTKPLMIAKSAAPKTNSPAPAMGKPLIVTGRKNSERTTPAAPEMAGEPQRAPEKFAGTAETTEPGVAPEAKSAVSPTPAAQTSEGPGTFSSGDAPIVSSTPAQSPTGSAVESTKGSASAPGKISAEATQPPLPATPKGSPRGSNEPVAGVNLASASSPARVASEPPSQLGPEVTRVQKRSGYDWLLWGASATTGLLGLAGLVVWFRLGRREQRPSLITQCLERERR